MWNQNSENKKTDDVSGAETVVATQAQHLQHHLPIISSNITDGNGKTTQTTTRNNLGGGGGGGGSGESNNFGHSATSKDKGNYSQEEATIDSGFLSGEQLTDEYSGFTPTPGAEDTDNSRGSKSNPPVQLNIIPNKQQKTHSALTENYLDSGCIDEDFEDDDAVQEQERERSHPSITTTAASPQQRGGGSSINTPQPKDDPMILDKGVESGLSEWFCKVSLTSQPVNNLGASQKQNAPDNDVTITSAADPWEIHYQQNNDGDTHLHLACITGYVDVVAALIRMAPHPCLFNIQNDEAQTSLHLAVIYGQPKILRMLLIAGAEPTARDRHGNTPLHLASISGDTQCVKALTIPISASEINEAHRSYGHLSTDMRTSYLLECARLPADLELRNYDGERCVHLAAQGGHIDILRHLVWFGADINAREGKSGRTPLHIAIECGNEILANFLLEDCSTLDIETATYAGLTAYQVACILGNPIMQNYLEKKGAHPLTPPESDYDSSDIETDLDDSQMYSRFGGPHYFANYNGGGNPINVA